MAAVLALTLTACGDSSGEKSSGSSSSASAGSGSLASIKLTGGDAKTAPTIELATKPLSVGAFETRVVKEGTGDAATEKDVVQVQYNLINGTTGAKIDSNWGTPSGFDLSDTQLIAGLRKSLLGAKKGATMLSALPPAEAFGTAGNTQLNIKATDTLVMAYEIVDKFTPLAQAEGTEEKLDPDLPKVTWKAGEAASFEMPKSDPPKKLVIQPLITGTGPTPGRCGAMARSSTPASPTAASSPSLSGASRSSPAGTRASSTSRSARDCCWLCPRTRATARKAAARSRAPTPSSSSWTSSPPTDPPLC